MNERLSYVRDLETQISTTKATLEKLKVERDQSMQAIQHEEIENLEKYLDQANVDLKGLSESSEEAWHQLKEALEQMMNDIRSSLQRLLGE
ncbi:MAG: hypothetical protein AAFX01_06240 [Cyanobacteria bacterium J06638_28]